MDFKEMVKKNRSYRRFDESHTLSREILVDLVELARYTASGGNKQPLKYLLSADPETNAKIFPCLVWAGYLKEWPGPAEGERPTGYIVVLLDERISKDPGVDHGIAAQTILLGAVEKGLGGCILGSIDRERLRGALKIPTGFKILLVLALGRPAEKVVIEDMNPGDDFKYWRDEKGVHHVPKRSLEELILE